MFMKKIWLLLIVIALGGCKMSSDTNEEDVDICELKENYDHFELQFLSKIDSDTEFTLAEDFFFSKQKKIDKSNSILIASRTGKIRAPEYSAENLLYLFDLYVKKTILADLSENKKFLWIVNNIQSIFCFSNNSDIIITYTPQDLIINSFELTSKQD